MPPACPVYPPELRHKPNWKRDTQHIYSIEQLRQDHTIQARQHQEFLHRHAFVDLVDRRVDRPELDDFRAEWCDEATIGCSAAGALFGFDAAVLADRRQHGFTQATRQAAERITGLILI